MPVRRHGFREKGAMEWDRRSFTPGRAEAEGISSVENWKAELQLSSLSGGVKRNRSRRFQNKSASEQVGRSGRKVSR